MRRFAVAILIPRVFVFHGAVVCSSLLVPSQVLNTQENLLAHHDVEVLQRFVELNLTAKDYVWPLLQSMFSDVFAETEWLRVWDNIVSNHPGFSMYIALAYVVASRV